MNISKRLKEVSNLIEKESSILDVGTDHGYLPLFLEENRNFEKIVATDISTDSLNKLKSKLDKTSKIETKLQDGLEYLIDNEAEYVSICGMGARLIINILEKAKSYRENAKYYIFQPNTTIYELREYLLFNGFKILDEVSVVEDGYYYNIIKATFGQKEDYKDYELKYSKILLEKKDKNTLNYLKKEKDRYISIREKENISDNRKKQIEKELILIERALKRYEL